MKILIKDTAILRMVDQTEGILYGDIAIEDDKIVAIGTVPDGFAPDHVIEGKKQLAMPGLINAHTHMAMSLMRNYADDLPLMTWLSEKIWPIEAGLTPDDVYLGTMLSIAEMIRSGSTTFNDMYFEMEEVAKAVEISGVRANLSRGMIGNDTEGLEKLENSRAFHEAWNGKADGRIVVDIAPHAPYTCSDGFIKKAVSLSKELNTQIHVHLSESLFEVNESLEKYGVTPIKKMEDLGMFEVKTNAAHCVHLHDEDFEILKKHDVSVLYNPSSNLKLGNGFAKVSKMIGMGINVALGTDGSSSNNNINMFEEMHLCALVNKGIEADPTAIPAYKALEIATINGAKALGIDDMVGTLEIGKKADLILVDLNKPHLVPQYDLVAMLVYSAAASDVKTVLCNGKVLMQDYEIKSFDEKLILAMADEAAHNLVKRTQK